MRLNNTGKYCGITLKIIIQKIFVSDEAHFDLDGYVNKQNCRIWGTEKPHLYIEKSTHELLISADFGPEA